MRHRTLAVITTTTLLVTMAAGCTTVTTAPIEPPSLREQAQFTRLDVPPAMTTDPGAWVAPKMVGAVLGHEWALAAVRSTPEVQEIGVWWPGQDGGVGVEPSATITFDDPFVEFDLAGDAGIVVTVGTAWSEGHQIPFAKASADGIRWTDVALPDALEGSTLSRVTALGDGKFAAVGTTPTGEVGGVVIAGDGSTQTFSLGVGAVDGVRGVAGQGADMVVITEGQTERAMTSHHSADGGLTWTSSPLPPAIVKVAGLARVGGEYVFTGAALWQGVTGSSYTHYAGGASTDGADWSIDGWQFRPDLDGMGADPERGIDSSDGAASWFGEPVVVGERMTALISTGSRRYAIPAERFEGNWQTSMIMLPDQQLGPTGMTVPTGEASLVTTSGGGGLLRVTAGTPFKDDTRTLVDLGASGWAFRPVDGADSGGAIVQASRRYFTELEDGGWRSGVTGAWFTVTDDALVDAEPPFPMLPDGGDVLFATNPEHQTIAVSSGFDPETGFAIRAVVAGEGETPTEAALLPSEGFALAAGVAWTGGGWTVAGASATNGSASRKNVGALWTSPDAVHWSREATFDAGTDGSVSEVCAGTAGPLVLGSVSVEARPHATTWYRGADGAWNATTNAVADSSWSGCTAFGDVVVAALREPSGSRLMTVADDGTTTEVLDLGRNTIDTLHLAGGGLAAVGSVTSDDYCGPVLWLSPDGLSWEWVPVPAATAIDPGALAVDGDSVIVFTTGQATTEAWRVEGVADLMRLIDVASPVPSAPAPSASATPER